MVLIGTQHQAGLHVLFSGTIWECACGDGAMARVLEETGCPVISSDLHNRGFGKPGVDFLQAVDKVDNVVTNPPYNCAEPFVQIALRISAHFFFASPFLKGPTGTERSPLRHHPLGSGFFLRGSLS